MPSLLFSKYIDLSCPEKMNSTYTKDCYLGYFSYPINKSQVVLT